MGDQKDNVLVQKKETESNLIETESTQLESTIESLPPPTFQLVSNSDNEGKDEESAAKEGAELTEFQFSLTPPPEEASDKNSKIFSTKGSQGITQPFRMPTTDSEKLKPSNTRNLDKPSFKLKK